MWGKGGDDTSVADPNSEADRKSPFLAVVTAVSTSECVTSSNAHTKSFGHRMTSQAALLVLRLCTKDNYQNASI